MSEVQNAYKLPLNLHLTVFTGESASNIIGYQHTFEHNR
jgi:hypothetical protein